MTSTNPQNAGAKEDLLRGQLTNAVTLAAKQDQIVWTVFGVFWAANAVLLVALFTDTEVPLRTVGIIVSSFGGLTAGIWCLVQWRAIRFMNYYDALIESLEHRLLAGDQKIAVGGELNTEAFLIAVSGKLNTKLFRKHVTGMRTRPLLIGFALLVFLGWLAAFKYFVFFARAG